MNPIASLLVEIGGEFGGLDNALKGALGSLGNAAASFAKVGLGIGLAAGAAIGGGILSSIHEAMQSQEALAGLDAVLKSTGEAAKTQAQDFAEASKVMVTATAMPAEKLKTLADQLEKAQARVEDLSDSMSRSKNPSASMALNLERAQESVADLQQQIAKGATVMTTTLANQMGLVPPAIQPTRAELLKLADQLQSTTKFSDEMVIGAEAILLRFKTLGKDIFPQATRTVLDLATALKTDASTAATMLGKALVDPGVGLLRLKAAGVALDDSQIKLIKSLHDTGQTAKAQQMILDELEKSIGGAAEAAGNTFAGKLTILGNKFSDLQETIGMAFLPMLTELADGLIGALASPEVQAAVNSIVRWVTTVIPTAIKGLVAFLSSFKGESAGGIASILLGSLGISSDMAAKIGNFVDNFISVMTGAFQGKFDLTTVLAGVFGTGAIPAGEFLTGLQEKFQGLIDWVDKTLVPKLTESFAKISTAAGPTFETLGGTINENVLPALGELGRILNEELAKGFIVSGEQLIWFIGEATKLTEWILKTGLPVFGKWADDVGGRFNKSLDDANSLFKTLNPLVKDASLLILSMQQNVLTLAGAVNNVLAGGLSTFNQTVLVPIRDTFAEIVGVIEGVNKQLAILADLLGIGPAGLRAAFEAMFPGRAMGGLVSSGSSYLVGEKGPEIFTANRSGTIIPNSKLGSGGSKTINVYLTYAPTVSLMDEAEAQTKLGPFIRSALAGI